MQKEVNLAMFKCEGRSLLPRDTLQPSTLQCSGKLVSLPGKQEPNDNGIT